MKEKRLLKAMDKVDGKYIEEASPTQQTKKPSWLKWGGIAACFALVLLIGTFLLHTPQDDDVTIGSSVADAAPMVYVNDTLYKQSADQQGYSEYSDEFIYIGQILSDVTNNQDGGTDGVPKDNFQANHPIVGCEVYQYGENIVVKINSSYWLYVKMKQSH